MASVCGCVPKTDAECSPPAGARAANGLPSNRPRRFPRSERLRRRAEFQRVYSQGIRVAGRHVVLFAMRTEGSSRLGVTASRKIGNAVIRARAKRRLRELYRLRQSTTVTEALDLVVNARRSCVSVPWQSLARDFESCLERLGERMNADRR